MSPLHRPFIAGPFAAMALAASGPALAEAVAQRPAVIHSQYQFRVDRQASGQTPQLFLGTASVAPNRAFPWAVSLQIRGTEPQLGHFCGGVLIDASWVLTAAHCVSGANPTGDQFKIVPVEADKIQILAGSNVLFRGGQIKTIAGIILHPESRIASGRVTDNDLALLQISEPLTQAPLKLATASQANELLKDGAKIRTLGWGTASFAPDSPVSNNLLYAFTDVVGQSKCNEPDAFDGVVTDAMFCAGVGTSYACQGDSGGPAVGYSNGVPLLLGVVSWGNGCGSKKPTVYANVVQHAGWIYETIGRSR